MSLHKAAARNDVPAVRMPRRQLGGNLPLTPSPDGDLTPRPRPRSEPMSIPPTRSYPHWRLSQTSNTTIFLDRRPQGSEPARSDLHVLLTTFTTLHVRRLLDLLRDALPLVVDPSLLNSFLTPLTYCATVRAYGHGLPQRARTSLGHRHPQRRVARVPGGNGRVVSSGRLRRHVQ